MSRPARTNISRRFFLRFRTPVSLLKRRSSHSVAVKNSSFSWLLFRKFDGFDVFFVSSSLRCYVFVVAQLQPQLRRLTVLLVFVIFSRKISGFDVFRVIVRFVLQLFCRCRSIASTSISFSLTWYVVQRRHEFLHTVLLLTPGSIAHCFFVRFVFSSCRRRSRRRQLQLQANVSFLFVWRIAEAEAAAAAALQAQINAAVVAALAAQAAVPAPVAHVAVKLPDFWVKDPKMWFSQAEAQFRRARITAQTTMYDYVLMKLPEDVGPGFGDWNRSGQAGGVLHFDKGGPDGILW